jgi:hypothetical protein
MPATVCFIQQLPMEIFLRKKEGVPLMFGRKNNGNGRL